MPHRVTIESVARFALWPPRPIINFPGVVPAGFTLQNYLDDSPAVNGRFMIMFARITPGKRVTLPCKVLDFNQKNETARVLCADGFVVTVIDLKAAIENRCIQVWGTPTAHNVLSAEEISILPDDHDFQRSDLAIEYLMHPKAWGEPNPYLESTEAVDLGIDIMLKICGDESPIYTD